MENRDTYGRRYVAAVSQILIYAINELQFGEKFMMRLALGIVSTDRVQKEVK